MSVFVCLAVDPKLLFYSLIMTIGPWQPDTPQLAERKPPPLKSSSFDLRQRSLLWHISKTDAALEGNKWRGLIMAACPRGLGRLDALLLWVFASLELQREGS